MVTARHARIEQLVHYFLRLGLLGFGGPIALVGQMERDLVTERGWLTKQQMREAIAGFGMEDAMQWSLAAVCFAVTLLLHLPWA